ncbi:MAG: hypothetical protein ACOCQV_02855 [Halolamina sp.]
MSARVDTGIIPDWREMVSSAVGWAKKAVWAGDPVEQIAVNLVIVVVLMLSSAVGFVVGIPIAMLALTLAGVGVVRLLYRAVM